VTTVTPTPSSTDVTEVAPGIWRVRDTCNVYLIAAEVAPGDDTAERTAVAVDFGAGRVLDALEPLGITRITDIVMTHHHRDQGQGLPLAVAHGARIHVPPVEVDLFADVGEMWRTRQLDNDYGVRQDRFSLLEPVPVAGTVPEYRTADFGGVALRTIPTPGHTVGSVTYLLDRGGNRIAFSGDLIHSPGKVWSLAATQWSYTGDEGPAMAVLACHLLQDEQPDLLLPSHGEPMAEAADALDLLAGRMQYYVDSRRWESWDLKERLRHPFERLSEHLSWNRSSTSWSYVLRSETGEALLIDYGYDMTTGLPPGQERAARRPWLASLPAMRADLGVTRIVAALPTHYHDDHVAGMPLLRAVEGTEIWAPSTVAPVLADPWANDLPCQWYEPIPADRVLPVGESFRWNEYEITVHDLPGHTLFHVGYEVTVDGGTVLFTGDQQETLGIPDRRHEVLNYQYRNRFRLGDYEASARLFRRVAPGLLLSGHWAPRQTDEEYLEFIGFAAEDLRQTHEALLPLEELDLGTDSVLARLTPYRARADRGSVHTVTVEVRNPFREPAEAVLRPVVPDGWHVLEPEVAVTLSAGEERRVPLAVVVGDRPATRARIAVDVTIGDLRLGQHAEALVEVR
jgi:glyoxylase-like metal-dependent hydrolase (beta-lactamase superfamily II)